MLILLYYKFVPIEDPEVLTADQLELCRRLGLKGRIIVATEGINGTLSGSEESAGAYIEHMREDPRFADMAWKVDRHHEHAFKRLSVKCRPEIVTLGMTLDTPVHERTGVHLGPAAFRERLSDPDALVIDGRNDYEWDLGHFRGAVRPEFTNFKESVDWLRKTVGTDRGRPILTYCTGGVRCEKLTAFLIQEGFENVYQLEGGIVEYGKNPETRGELFDGKCFVFDERIAVSINDTPTARVVARCHLCGQPSENYVNCANVVCNLLFICCPVCEESHARCCSQACQTAPAHRAKGGKLSKTNVTGKLQRSLQ